MARQPSSPLITPQPAPTRKAARRPRRRANAPKGSVASAMPTTKTEIATVAKAGLGAIAAPTMPPVA